jgi:hypothetical protein
MLDAVQGRDTSVRDTISKGRFVQGAQHPRIFDRGHINPASGGSVADPYHVDAGPDPIYHFDADSDPDPDFYFMRIRILIFI